MKNTHRRKADKVKSRLNQLNAIIGRRSKLPLRIKKRIYEAAVILIITYVASI